jgi:hypothetical protein
MCRRPRHNFSSKFRLQPELDSWLHRYAIATKPSDKRRKMVCRVVAGALVAICVVNIWDRCYDFVNIAADLQSRGQNKLSYHWLKKRSLSPD